MPHKDNPADVGSACVLGNIVVGTFRSTQRFPSAMMIGIVG